MKRGAEKYLTDRNAEEDEEDEDEVQMTGSSEGFKQAAPTELARRPIRALPGKRSAATTPAASPGPAPTAGFSFGSASPAPSFGAAPATSFAFGGSSSTGATAAKPASNGFSFGAPTSAGNSAPSKAAQSNASSDQDADVQYYSALRGLNLSVVPPIQRLLEKDPFTDLSEALKKILDNYRKERSSIDGKRQASSSTSRRQEGTSKPNTTANGSEGAGQASKPMFSFAAPSSGSSAAPTPSPPAPSAPAPAKPFSGFAFGGTSSSPAPTSTPAETAPPMKEQPAAAKPFSGFSFGSSASSTPSPAPVSSDKKVEEPKPAARAKASEPEAAKGPVPPAPPAMFSFAGNTFKPDPSKTTSSSSGSATPGGFTFNPSKSESSGEKSAFAFPPASSTTTQDADKLSPEPAANGKSSSNNLSSNAAPFFPGANSRARQPSPLRQVETVPAESKAKETVSAPKPFSGFSFGGAPAASSTPASTTASTPPKAFSFGSATTATSPKAAPTFGFGASSGSPKGFSASAGFSFGSPQPTASSTSAPSTSAFSFGSSSSTNTAAPTISAFGSTTSLAGGSSGGFGGFSFQPSTTSTGSPFGGSSGTATPGASTNGTPAPDADNATDEAQEPSENTLLKGGAGEENEETICEARAKLWKNEKRKVKEGDNEVEKTEFVQHGISIVKLNRNKETGKVRMLGRSDANGRVQINFALFKDLNIRFEKSFLTFMAFENGEPILLRLKLRNAELAGNLKNAIEAEVSNLS